jgi:hypothetical protein
VFLGFTAGTILIANRWYGDPLYVPIFFGAVMGGWLKFVVFLVVLFLLRGQPWLNPASSSRSSRASSLARHRRGRDDRMRVPAVSDVTCHPRGRRRRGASPAPPEEDAASGRHADDNPRADRLSLRPFALRETRAQ